MKCQITCLVVLERGPLVIVKTDEVHLRNRKDALFAIEFHPASRSSVDLRLQKDPADLRAGRSFESPCRSGRTRMFARDERSPHNAALCTEPQYSLGQMAIIAV